MALDKGTAWAIYLLMAQHNDPATPGARSGLRHRFDDNVKSGMSSKDALADAVNDQLHVNVSHAIGDPGGGSADELRKALQMGYTGPDCPGSTDQNNLFAALKGKL